MWWNLAVSFHSPTQIKIFFVLWNKNEIIRFRFSTALFWWWRSCQMMVLCCWMIAIVPLTWFSFISILSFSLTLSPSLNIHPTFNLEIFSFSFSHSITTPYVECNRPTTLYTLTSIDDVIRFYSIRSCIGVCICSFSLPSINILESIYTKGKRTHTHTHTRTTT